MAESGSIARSRILVVEDDPIQAAVISELLREQGARVDCLSTLADGRLRLRGAPIDLLLLDRTLPDGEGLLLCEEIRATPELREMPVILITARDSVEDRVAGLMRGADDYIPKPFHPKEFLARVHGCLRTLALQRELKAQAEELAEKNRLLLEAQERVVRSERLAAIGEVGLAIRHEINNPLGTILGFSDLLLMQAESLPAEAQRKVELIRRSALRIRDVVRRLEDLRDDRPVEYIPGLQMTDLGPPPASDLTAKRSPKSGDATNASSGTSRPGCDATRTRDARGPETPPGGNA
jgi:CheY-like chemotaxis protein